MTEEELRKDFETAYKIFKAERRMREHVFRGDTVKRDAKTTEMDKLREIVTRLKDELKAHVGGGYVEQPTRLDVPRKAEYV